MTNLKLKRLLKSLAVAVAPTAAALTVVACKNSKKDPAAQLSTNITKGLENAGAVFYVGGSIAETITLIKKIVKNTTAYDKVKYNLENPEVKFMKDGTTEALTTGTLEKVKYNYEVKISGKGEENNKPSDVVIKGSATVTKESKEAITKDKLDGFDTSTIDKNLGTVETDTVLTPTVTQRINEAILGQFGGYNVELTLTTEGDNAKAIDSKKSGHEFVFTLKTTNPALTSKEFKIKFTYKIGVLVELNSAQAKADEITDLTVAGAATNDLTKTKAVVTAKMNDLITKLKEAFTEQDKKNLIIVANLEVGDVFAGKTGGTALTDAQVKEAKSVFVEVKPTNAGKTAGLKGSVRVKVAITA